MPVPKGQEQGQRSIQPPDLQLRPIFSPPNQTGPRTAFGTYHPSSWQTPSQYTIQEERRKEAHKEGHRAGFQEGQQAGYEQGHEAGYNKGYEACHQAGDQASHQKGYQEGYQAGYRAGCEVGHHNGYYEGYHAALNGQPPQAKLEAGEQTPWNQLLHGTHDNENNVYPDPTTLAPAGDGGGSQSTKKRRENHKRSKTFDDDEEWIPSIRE
ncbi:hypothetical protein ONZ43_g5013 [Nemania bipapillata]|uniref:Uncharacterized protein n=1 Tax=Nemania bipapillata TaxID=110536 RepID=A0ACC2IFK0_9PEZI|nr:hypothetical protein ONZ43_g5013 [Nemania bipapillata]